MTESHKVLAITPSFSMPQDTEKVSLQSTIGLFGELNDLKRLHAADIRGSLAEHLFRWAWSQIYLGKHLGEVALQTTACAVASARLGAIDADVLSAAGLSSAQATKILQDSINSVSHWIDPSLLTNLKQQFTIRRAPLEQSPAFVDTLCRQPRAGATRPGMARLVLTPSESHGDHCLMVAVYSVLLAHRYAGDVETPFLISLTHHLHNAFLPDSGFTGESLLGEHLPNVIEHFRAKALEQLAPALRTQILDALATTMQAHTAAAKIFHAADVLDRVLQMRWYQQAASFTLDQALGDLELVHEGPVQHFQLQVLREAGLWP